MKISIITVCLNSEKTIEQTIQSVINQDDRDCEYIIVDGGSTDKTIEIIEKYRNHITRIISGPDRGIYDAMNKGIASSCGDIVGIINSDDWYEPGTFDMVRRCFQESDAEAVYGRMNLIYEDGRTEALIPSDIEKMRYEMEIPHSTVFLKKEIYEKYGPFRLEYHIAADYEFILKLYTKGVRFAYLDQTLANFRMSGVSVQQGETCSKETLMAARKYLRYAPLDKRASVKNILFHRKQALYFENVLKNLPGKLYDVLLEKEGVGLHDEIAIFGAGNWGKLVHDILKQRGLRISFFIDSDAEKRGITENGTPVLEPEALKAFCGVLLLMVRESSYEILLQVEKIKNPAVYCITWEDMINELVWSSSWEKFVSR